MRASNYQQDQELALVRDEMRVIKETLSMLVQSQQQQQFRPQNLAPPQETHFHQSSSPGRPNQMAQSNMMRQSNMTHASQYRPSPSKQHEVESYNNELENLTTTKNELENRLRLVNELDQGYRQKLENAYKDEFQQEITTTLDRKSEQQYGKMSKLITDLQNDNYRLKKEFDQYQNSADDRNGLDKARTTLIDMKIEKLMGEFTEKYRENPAFHDVLCDTEMVEEMWKEKNLKELFANLMTFTMHGAFSKKPVVVKKK